MFKAVTYLPHAEAMGPITGGDIGNIHELTLGGLCDFLINHEV